MSAAPTALGGAVVPLQESRPTGDDQGVPRGPLPPECREAGCRTAPAAGRPTFSEIAPAACGSPLTRTRIRGGTTVDAAGVEPDPSHETIIFSCVRWA